MTGALFYGKATLFTHSLISAFVVRFLDSIIALVSIPEISSLYLASMAEQAGLSLPWFTVVYLHRFFSFRHFNRC